MGWIKRDADVHRCVKPTWERGSDVKSGDQWQCDTCGAVHEVTVRSDPRDTWFDWKQIVSPDPEQVNPNIITFDLGALSKDQRRRLETDANWHGLGIGPYLVAYALKTLPKGC